MAFMSLALSFMTLEELAHKLSEPILETLIIVIVFVLIPQHILGAVLLARGCSARSKGHPVLATGLQCIGVILLIPVLLSMASIPVFFIICMLQ